MPFEYVCSGWACRDCVILLANGDAPPDMNEEDVQAWEGEINRRTAGYDVTLGMLREQHACATNYTVRDVLTGIEYEYRADSASDAQDQHGFDHDYLAITITAHELETTQDRDGECYCERVDFTWSPCDVCGSNLGGDRDAVTFFRVTADVPA